MIKKIITITVLAIFIISCGGHKRTFKKRKEKNPIPTVVIDDHKPPAETSPKTERAVEAAPYDNVQAYINAFSAIAKEEMRLYKIPASITMAQAVLESGAGRGELTLKANNHFGIKCHDWTGDHVYHDDDQRGECFRKYKDPKYSFQDHSIFLTGRQRYASLFDLDPDDYEGWAKGLRKAGYATDRHYPDKLIEIVERYKLYLLDSEVLGSNPQKFVENSKHVVTIHTVKKGETLYSIARLYNLSVDELKNTNDLKTNIISVGQQLNVKPQYRGF